MGGGQRVAEAGRQQDDRGGGGLGRHALRRLDLHQALAQGADHPPAADVGAEADRYRAGDDDPERRGRVGGQRAVRDQGQRDDAHRLLRVVRAVRQGHHGGRADLPDPEAVVAAPGGEAAADPVEQPGAGRGDQHRDDRRQHGREDNLGDQAVPLDRLAARGGQHRADHPADQRLRRARRDPEEPGEQVPNDRADQAVARGQGDGRHDDGGHHGQRHQLGVYQAAGDRGRDGQGQERPDQVEHSGQGDRDPRPQRAGGDRGSHRVARVMEPVGEVEGESRYHHEAQYYVVAHPFRVATRKLGVETPETTVNRYSPAV